VYFFKFARLFTKISAVFEQSLKFELISIGLGLHDNLKLFKLVQTY